MIGLLEGLQMARLSHEAVEAADRGSSLAREWQEALPMSRRGLLGGAAFSLPVVLGACKPVESAAVSVNLVPILCDIVLPTTATPGARTRPNVDFITNALDHGLFGGDVGTLLAFEAQLDKVANGTKYVDLPRRSQVCILSAIDTKAYAAGVSTPAPQALSQAGSAPAAEHATSDDPEAVWRTIKNAIVVSYYTSETGGSKELLYELVPGRYDADIPLDPKAPYLSNNWSGNLA